MCLHLDIPVVVVVVHHMFTAVTFQPLQRTETQYNSGVPVKDRVTNEEDHHQDTRWPKQTTTTTTTTTRYKVAKTNPGTHISHIYITSCQRVILSLTIVHAQ